MVPLRCSSPPLDGVGHPEVEAQEEELRGFGRLSVGVSCGPPGSADSPESRSSLKPPPPIKSAAHQAGCGLHLPVKHSQPTFSTDLASGCNETDTEPQALKAEDEYRIADTRAASAANARLQREELGFADFAVFTEQAVHHWCCGFTPSGNPGTFNSRLGQRNPANSPLERTWSPGQVASGDADPHCSSKEKGCAMIRPWQEGDAAVVQQRQDQQQPQETAAASVLPPENEYVEGVESEEKDRTRAGIRFETSEVGGDGGEQSGEQEEPGSRRAGDIGAVTRTQATGEEDLHRFNSSATQENSATSSPPHSGARRHVSGADCGAEGQRAEAAVLVLGTLPPSDSFADFCSAPVRDDGEDLWAEFTDMKAEEGEPAGTRERGGSVPAEDGDKAEQCGVRRGLIS